jgi:hypothetical protein
MPSFDKNLNTSLGKPALFAIAFPVDRVRNN